MNGHQACEPRTGHARALRGIALVAAAVFAAAVAAGCGRHHREAKTQEEFRQKFDRMTEKTLKKVDATDDQKAKIRPIADDLAKSLWGFREEHRAIRERFLKAFEAPTVDGAEVARIRTDAMALADRTSAAVTGAIVKASAILSPEQRGKLASRWRKCYR